MKNKRLNKFIIGLAVVSCFGMATSLAVSSFVSQEPEVKEAKADTAPDNLPGKQINNNLSPREYEFWSWDAAPSVIDPTGTATYATYILNPNDSVTFTLVQGGDPFYVRYTDVEYRLREGEQLTITQIVGLSMIPTEVSEVKDDFTQLHTPYDNPSVTGLMVSFKNTGSDVITFNIGHVNVQTTFGFKEITLNKNDGTGGSNKVYYSEDRDMLYKDAPTTLPLTEYAIEAPTKANYTFLGYYADVMLNQKVIDGTTLKLATGDLSLVSNNLYAKWEAGYSHVYLDGQGGTNMYADIQYGKAPDINFLDVSGVVRPGYTFSGYYDEPNGQGTEYINDSGNLVHTWDKDVGNQTLYACWLPNHYDITLEKFFPSATGGTTAVGVFSGDAIPSIAVPSLEGYTFLGYYDKFYLSTTDELVQYIDKDGHGVRVWDLADQENLYALWQKDGYESFVHLTVRDATCTEKGYRSEAWHDEADNRYYYDPNGQFEILPRGIYEDLEIVPAKGHNYEFSKFEWSENHLSAQAVYVCSNDNNHVLKYDATVTSTVVTQPTTSSKGITKYVATYEEKTQELLIDDIPALKKSVTDTVVTIRYSDGTTFEGDVVVERTAKEETSIEQVKVLAGKNKIAAIYDIKLAQKGAYIQPNGKITITVELPDAVNLKNFKIIHAHTVDDVSYIENYTLDGNKVSFEVEALSEFVFVNVDSGLPGWAIALIVIGSVLLALGIAYGLLFFVFNKYVRDGEKEVRAFGFPFIKKEDKILVITMFCKVLFLKEDELYKK